MEFQRVFTGAVWEGQIIRSRTTRGLAMILALCAMLAGCAQNAYERVRLGETMCKDLPSILGGGPYSKNAWAVQSWWNGSLGGSTSVAVLCDDNGRSCAKILFDYALPHQLALGEPTCDERVEIRVDPGEMERIVRECANRSLDELAEGRKVGQPTTTMPTDDSAPALRHARQTDLADAVRTYAACIRALRSRRASAKDAPEGTPKVVFSDEQVPLAVLLGLHVGPPCDAAEPDREDANLLRAMRALAVVASYSRRSIGLLPQAEANHLYSAPAPIELDTGTCRVRKIAAGWYELRFKAGQDQAPTADSTKAGSARAAQREESRGL